MDFDGSGRVIRTYRRFQSPAAAAVVFTLFIPRVATSLRGGFPGVIYGRGRGYICEWI